MPALGLGLGLARAAAVGVVSTPPPPPDDEAPAITSGPVIVSTGNLSSPVVGDTLSLDSITFTGYPTPTITLYQWKRDSGSGFTDISGADSDSYVLTEDDLGAVIVLVLKVENSEGYAIGQSDATGTVTGADTGPVQPSGFSVLSVAHEKVTFTWTAVEGLTYKLYGSVNTNIEEAVLLMSGVLPPQTVTSGLYLIADGQTNYYWVAANDGASDSPPAGWVAGTPYYNGPCAVTGLHLDTYILYWDDNREWPAVETFDITWVINDNPGSSTASSPGFYGMGLIADFAACHRLTVCVRHTRKAG